MSNNLFKIYNFDYMDRSYNYLSKIDSIIKHKLSDSLVDKVDNVERSIKTHMEKVMVNQLIYLIWIARYYGIESLGRVSDIVKVNEPRNVIHFVDIYNDDNCYIKEVENRSRYDFIKDGESVLDFKVSKAWLDSIINHKNNKKILSPVINNQKGLSENRRLCGVRVKDKEWFIKFIEINNLYKEKIDNYLSNYSDKNNIKEIKEIFSDCIDFSNINKYI